MKGGEKMKKYAKPQVKKVMIPSAAVIKH